MSEEQRTMLVAAAATQGCTTLPVGLLQAYLDNHGVDFQSMVQQMREWLEITAPQAAQEQFPNWQSLQTILHKLRAALPCTSPMHQSTLDWLAMLQSLDMPNLMATVKREEMSLNQHRFQRQPYAPPPAAGGWSFVSVLTVVGTAIVSGAAAVVISAANQASATTQGVVGAASCVVGAMAAFQCAGPRRTPALTMAGEV